MKGSRDEVPDFKLSRAKASGSDKPSDEKPVEVVKRPVEKPLEKPLKSP